MGRRTEPKCKQCRREGEKLYLKGDKCFTPKCPVSRRPFKPGMHGPTSRTRPTPFGIQLREKQKAKNTYGILETQFRNYFEKATRQVGNTGSFLVQMLEMRLDNVVYIRVNGKKVNIASYQTKPGDVITLTARISKSKLFSEETARLEKYQAPSWLHLDAAALTGKVLAKPQGEELKQNFDPKLIVEFYSR